jgi:hypothetical protein
MIPARDFFALVSVNENHRRNHHKARRHETKRLQPETEPPEKKKVAQTDGNRGQKNDEE